MAVKMGNFIFSNSECQAEHPNRWVEEEGQPLRGGWRHRLQGGQDQGSVDVNELIVIYIFCTIGWV